MSGWSDRSLLLVLFGLFYWLGWGNDDKDNNNNLPFSKTLFLTHTFLDRTTIYSSTSFCLTHFRLTAHPSHQCGSHFKLGQGHNVRTNFPVLPKPSLESTRNEPHWITAPNAKSVQGRPCSTYACTHRSCRDSGRTMALDLDRSSSIMGSVGCVRACMHACIVIEPLGNIECERC